MGGGAPDPVDPSGLINPDQFVCSWTTLDTSSIEAGASSLRTMGTKVRDEVQGMRMTWSSLPASYEGPEQELVYSLLNDPRDAAEDLKERLNSAAVQLDTYAMVLFDIALDLMDLESEAREFRARAQAGYVEEKQYAVGGNSPNRTKTEEVAWDEHGTAVEKNNTLLARYAGLMERISSAAAYCANSINELQMGTVESAFTPVTADAIMNSSQPMPWGSPVAEDRNCGESVWDGTGNFVKNSAVGVSSMAGFDFDDSTTWGQTMKQSWVGAADFGFSSLVAITPVTYLAYVPGISGTGAGQFMQERHRTARDGVGSIVGWDGAAAEAGGDGWHAWKEDPVAAGTETVLNIGTFFIPVGGAVAGGGKVLSTAGRAGRLAKGARGGKHVKGNAADFVMPAGANITKGSTGVFSKGVETSRGRTGVLEDVELEPSPTPSRPGDGAETDPGADAGPPSSSADGSRAAEPPRGRDETDPGGTGDSGDSAAPGRSAETSAPEGRVDTASGGAESHQGDGRGPENSVDAANRAADPGEQSAAPAGRGASKQWAPPAVEHHVDFEGKVGSRTQFPPKGVELEANTAYEVAGRGTYYTDATGRVTHVVTDYGPSSTPNPDLNHPAPNTTYVVNDKHVFVTDAKSRTVEVHAPHLERAEAPRSGSIQQSVGRSAGPGYDGGHFIQNALGGGRERINIAGMLEELNRSGSRTYRPVAQNYYQIEARLRSAIDGGSEVGESVYLKYGESDTPSRITIQYTIDGEAKRRVFQNVRH
ncbi:hypothetical protein GCM10009625_25100 [Brachybacterium fresconis]